MHQFTQYFLSINLTSPNYAVCGQRWVFKVTCVRCLIVVASSSPAHLINLQIVLTLASFGEL